MKEEKTVTMELTEDEVFDLLVGHIIYTRGKVWLGWAGLLLFIALGVVLELEGILDLKAWVSSTIAFSALLLEVPLIKEWTRGMKLAKQEAEQLFKDRY